MRRRINVRKFSRKQKFGTVLGAGAIALAGAGVAVAFWSSSGTGDGSATTAAGEANTLAVTQTSTLTNLGPGVTASNITAIVKNTGSSLAQVNQVVVSIQSVDKAAGVVGTCDATDYSLLNTTMTNAAAELAGGATSGAFSGATLAFNDKPLTNQDACKGATVNLHYVAS
jgi:hypothetical protein